MDDIIISLAFDVLIAVLLGATIVFAARLSIHLKAFRDSRSELQNLIGDLASHIEKAEVSIQGLRQYSTDSARELQEQIDEAVSLRDELQLMTEGGDRLASRLEDAVDKSSAVQKMRRNESVDDKPRDEGPSFNIHDPEFASGDDTYAEGQESWDNEDWDAGYDGGDEIQSEAEKDLYEALQQKQKVKGG